MLLSDLMKKKRETQEHFLDRLYLSSGRFNDSFYFEFERPHTELPFSEQKIKGKLTEEQVKARLMILPHNPKSGDFVEQEIR